MSDQDEKNFDVDERAEEIRQMSGQMMPPAFEDAPYAESFQEWIDSYEHDVRIFKEILQDENASGELRRMIAGALMYLIRQFDLIPDHYVPLGIVDDCMVLRITADLGSDHTGELDPNHLKQLYKLAADAETIKEFFGEDLYRNLENLTREQPEKPVHHITGEAAVSTRSVQRDLVRQVDDELKTFKAGRIEDGAKAEREIRSYVTAKIG